MGFKKILAFVCLFCLIFSATVIVAPAENTGDLRGDADGDGTVSIKDVVTIRKYFAYLDYSTGISSIELSDNADMNGNGIIDLNDLIMLREYVANMDFDTETDIETEIETETEVSGCSHVFEEYQRDEEEHWQICSDCGYVSDAEAHVNGWDGYCRVCETLRATEDVEYGVGDGYAYVSNSGYDGSATSIVIAREYNGLPVTEISARAFKNASMVSIYIPSNVTSIGDNAFDCCTKLSSVIFEENSMLETIGKYAFNACSVLKSITIPENVTKINTYAFCDYLETAIFENPNGWTYPTFSGLRIESISASLLKDPSSAADCLGWKYRQQTWTRK